jgi:polyisoprenoid-binding protein YceI
MATTQAPVTSTAGSTWQIDPSHSHIEFGVRHMMISTVKGRFAEFTGTVEADETNPARSTVRVEIAAKSIDTRAEQRDGHLRSPDFLDVERFPTITFASKRVERAGDGLRLIGDLTIRDVTREIALDVEDGGRGMDPWGQQRAAFHASGKLDRTEFGLNWNQALEAGGILVGNDVKISIDIELVKQQG